jgi:hypothetical protein
MEATFIGVFATIVVAIIGGWIQINSRISVLEVEVRNDHESYAQNQKKLDELMEKVSDVKETLIAMRGEMNLKADKKIIS